MTGDAHLANQAELAALDHEPSDVDAAYAKGWADALAEFVQRWDAELDKDAP